MWTNFMQSKYYKKVGPQMVKWKWGFLTWKYMLEEIEKFDQDIW